MMRKPRSRSGRIDVRDLAGDPIERRSRRARRIRQWAAIVLLMAPAFGVVGMDIPEIVRGPAVIHLLPKPGPLVVTVTKHDLNIYEGEDTVRLALYDPFRRPLAQAVIPDDGQAERGGGGRKPQVAEIQAVAKTEGIHSLIVSGACHEVVYGVKTNCELCVVEEKLLLNNSSVAGQVWFQPPEEEFTIRIQAKHNPGIQKVPLVDADGATVHVFDLQKAAKDKILKLTAQQGARGGLWHFDIGRMDVEMHIDGVRYWSPTREAYFSPGNRVNLMIPRSATRLVPPGGSASVTYRLRNRLQEAIRARVRVDPVESLRCRVVTPSGHVTLEPKQVLDVKVEAVAAQDAAKGREVETCVTLSVAGRPELSSGALLRVRVGQPRVAEALTLPIVLRPFMHEAALFGYDPDYVCNEVYFDPQNRAFIRQRELRVTETTGITMLQDGRWAYRPFMDALRAAHPAFTGACDGGGGFAGAKIAFDDRGGAYTLLRLRRKEQFKQCVLVFTPDDGRTFQILDLPGHAFDIEQFTGHNPPAGPPPVLVYRRTAAHARAKWGAVHDLLLYLPRRTGDRVELGKPITVSKRCLGSCQHSGGPGSVVTRNGKTHIVWGDVTDGDLPGVPSYVATYDHVTRTLTSPVFLAHAPPVDDVHNVPGVCLDSRGYIHAITGAHGRPFIYRRSLKPNDVTGGFTDPEPVLTDGRQTYLSLVCDPEDTLHIAYRQWRSDKPYHGGQSFAALSMQSKPRDGAWSPAKPMVIAPVPGYSIYYHKLTIDHRGRLFLSYNHWTTDKVYREDFPERYHHRAIMTSADRGKTWELAETRNFAP